MATKEDILEQLVEECLIHRGYFVRRDVKFLPRRDHPEFRGSEDSNHSDIDVLGFNPRNEGAERVWAGELQELAVHFQSRTNDYGHRGE